MDTNYKAIIGFAFVILALFAGGLYYIFKQNENRTIALNLVQEYIHTSNHDQLASLETQIRQRIEKRPIALTSRASFDSFETLIANGYACDQVAKNEIKLDPLNENRSYDEIWRDCMDNPELIPKKESFKKPVPTN